MKPASRPDHDSPPEVDESYRQWLLQKRTLKAPDGLTETVMDSLVDSVPQSPSQVKTSSSSWQRLLDMPWARAAVLMIAALLGFGRYALLLFCLIAS